MITILHEQRVTEHLLVCDTDTAIEANSDAVALWLDAPGIEAATGWQWKTEGLCQGDVCMPLPPAARTQWVRERPGEAAALNLAAMWRHSGQPVVHDAASRAWVLGTGSQQRGAALQTLQAPDFALPDLAGRMHRLSDYRGRKVLLATWASW